MAFINELKKDFRNLIDKSKLSHGYIFFGSNLGEQYLFAKELANYLEFKKWVSPDKILPDSLFIDEQKPGIGIVRAVTKFLWQKPVHSPKKILLINKAQNLTIYAQNAILKISEEPPGHSLIILIVKDPDVLIAPLKSRLQNIYFSARAEAPVFSKDLQRRVNQILIAPTAKERTEIIKKILEEEVDLNDFIAALVSDLKKDLMGNWRIIKDVSRRWALMNQFNVNKKLQMESMFFNVNQ